MYHTVEYQEPGQTGGFPAITPAMERAVSGSLSINDFLLRDIKNDKTLSIQRSDEASAQRQSVESFIAEVYFAVHQARLNAFMPELFAVDGDHQQPVAAIGLRFIDENPIFLERYLDSRVERCVSEIAGETVARTAIAEVGNLASMSLGAGRQLIAFMVYHLAACGIQQAVCTGTNAVRAALKRMGIDFTLISEARGECLGEEQANWGNYYQHNPFVLVVDIRRANRLLQPYYHYLQGK